MDSDGPLRSSVDCFNANTSDANTSSSPPPRALIGCLRLIAAVIAQLQTSASGALLPHPANTSVFPRRFRPSNSHPNMEMVVEAASGAAALFCSSCLIVLQQVY